MRVVVLSLYARHIRCHVCTPRCMERMRPSHREMGCLDASRAQRMMFAARCLAALPACRRAMKRTTWPSLRNSRRRGERACRRSRHFHTRHLRCSSMAASATLRSARWKCSASRHRCVAAVWARRAAHNCCRWAWRYSSALLATKARSKSVWVCLRWRSPPHPCSSKLRVIFPRAISARLCGLIPTSPASGSSSSRQANLPSTLFLCGIVRRSALSLLATRCLRAAASAARRASWASCSLHRVASSGSSLLPSKPVAMLTSCICSPTHCKSEWAPACCRVNWHPV